MTATLAFSAPTAPPLPAVPDNIGGKITIALDFDGFIATYESGWTGPTPTDPPMPGALEFVRWLIGTVGCEVIVHTVRAATPEGINGVVAWLARYGFPPLAVTAVKPAAALYADDNAYRFDDGDFGRLARFIVERIITPRRPGLLAKALSALFGERPQGVRITTEATDWPARDAQCAADKVALEKDAFFAEEDVAGLADDDPRRPMVAKARAEILERLAGLHRDQAVFAKSRKLHARRWIDGLHVSVENRKGSIRRWKDHDGKEGQTKVTHHYGYVRQTLGVDDDHVDCFLGPLATTEKIKGTTVYVIKTHKPPAFTELDEDKAMIGFASQEAAKQAFHENYSDPRFLAQMDAIPWEDFKPHLRATKHFGGFLQGEVVERGDRHAFAKGSLALVFGKAAHAKNADEVAESARIRESKESAEARAPHAFRPAKWTAGNGHPRCLLCGDEEPTGGRCSGVVAKAAVAPPLEAPQGPPQAGDVRGDELAGHLAGHLPALVKVVSTLQQGFPGAPVAGRLKETESLVSQVPGHGKGPVGEVADLASARVTVASTEEQTLALTRLRRLFGTAVQGEEDFNARPRGGYRGLHLTLRVEGVPVEVQVRTPRQTAWTDYAHDLLYRADGPLKPDVMQYLAALSDYLAAVDAGQKAEPPQAPPGLEKVGGPFKEPSGTVMASRPSPGKKPSAAAPKGGGKSAAPTPKQDADGEERGARATSQRGGGKAGGEGAKGRESAEGTDAPLLLAVHDNEAGKPVELRPLAEGEGDDPKLLLLAAAREKYPPPRYEVALGVAESPEAFGQSYPRFMRGGGA